MQLTMIAVGKLRETWAKLACEEYQQRLRTRFRFDLLEVRDETQIKKHLGPRSLVWMFDECGEPWSSAELSGHIKKAQESSVSSISLLIGGPDGFHDSLTQLADRKLSLSRMTFPYQLARVIVLEQLYRASAILKGEPYHR